MTNSTSAQPQRTRRAEPFRVGCLNVGAYSHLAIWAPFINPRSGQKDLALTGMRITHCWDIEANKAEQFAETYCCEAVKDFDGMLGKVDGIISAGYYNHPWSHVLHEPYLEAGLPNLINRPFANSMAKARRMVETANRHGAPILIPSAFEHNAGIASAKAWAQDKKILCYSATNTAHDYPTHGVHGLYMVCRAIAETGNPVVSVSYRADRWYEPPAVLTFEHADAEGRQFFGTLHESGTLEGIRIHTPEASGGEGFAVSRGSDYPYSTTELWAPVLWVYQAMAQFGDMPQTFEQILHKHNVFLAGWYSIVEKDGAPVKLDEVPDEWEAPVDLPNGPGDSTVAMFEKKFG